MLQIVSCFAELLGSIFVTNIYIYPSKSSHPNGGEAHQPGCEDEDAFGIDCSHARAPDFYIESITSDIGFLAWQCDNFQDFMAGFCYGRETNYMGEPANSAKPGIYFLQTNAQKPFAMPPTQN